jgi:hypothetical protein
MSTEQWKPIVGRPEFGLVSSFGNVKSPCGNLRKMQQAGNGYVRVGFQGGRVCLLVHRLVAEAFLDNPDEKRCVNHKDLCKSNNNVENLEWATHSENIKHFYDSGRRGADFRNRKLTNEQYENAYLRYKAGESVTTLCNEYTVGRASIYKKFSRLAATERTAS